MMYRHYPKADTLVIWQQYEGIYGDDGFEGLSPKEIDQLHSVLEGQRTFFFSNWITDYNAQRLADEVAKMRDKLRADDWTEEEKAFKRQLIALYKLIGENVRIENGPFYLNGEGKLSATQEVTVTKVSFIIAAANQAILSGLQLEIDSDSLDQSDPEYLPLVEKALKTKLKLFQLQGQRLQVHWPLTAGMFLDKDIQETINQFRQQGGRAMIKEGLVTVELGKLKGKEAKLEVVLPGTNFQSNALAHVRKRYEVMDQYDPAAARTDFFRAMDGLYKK